MELKEALKSRKSIRAFLDKEVSKDLIKDILELAKLSPSSTNTQPWELCIVSGNTKKSLDEKMLKAFDSGEKRGMEYKYYPDVFEKKFRTRQAKLGSELYELLGIKREDKKARLKQWRKNYTSFDAPVSIYFFLDKNLEQGSFLDIGLFIQSFCLLATNFGLATCIQGALGEFPDIVKNELNIENKLLVCGLALGYEDKSNIVNTMQSQRVSLDDFAKFFD